jgi:hypothetical protein
MPIYSTKMLRFLKADVTWRMKLGTPRMRFEKHARLLIELLSRGDRNISGVLGDFGASTGMFIRFDMSYDKKFLTLAVLSAKTVPHW